MQLSSSAFSDGSAIPRRFTCDGEDLSPPLEWGGAPAETQSFVLLCDDSDAPAGTWHHWAAYDIPAAQTTLAAGGAKHAERQGFNQTTTSSSRATVVLARRAAMGLITITSGCLHSRSNRLAIRQHPSCREVECEARKHVLAEAILVGIYER